MKTGTFLLSVLGSLLWLAAEARSQPSPTCEAGLNCLKAARTVLENCLAEIGDTAANSRQTAAQRAMGCQANFANVTKNCQSEVGLNCKPAPENPECDRLKSSYGNRFRAIWCVSQRSRSARDLHGKRGHSL